MGSRQYGDFLEQANIRGDVEDGDAAMQLGRRHVESDQREPLEESGVQGFESCALNRVVHQLIPLVIYDLMRGDVGERAAPLSIVMRDRPPLPRSARILLMLERPVEACRDRRHVERAYGRAGNTVGGRGKRRINDFFLGMINRALNFVVVERKFAWKGTIQSCLAERGPYLSHHYLSTPIVLAHSCYPRIDFLAAIYILDGRFAKQKIHVVLGFETADELRIVQPSGIVLVRSKIWRSKCSANGWIRARKVSRRPGEQSTGWTSCQ